MTDTLIQEIQHNLRRKMAEKGLTVSAVERQAGIRTSSLQNIAQGRSKNPSVTLLQQAAGVLECTVSELLGESTHTLSLTPYLKGPWKQDLYIEVATAVFKRCQASGMALSKKTLLTTVEQVYTYTIQYKKSKVDLDFLDWTLGQIEE